MNRTTQSETAHWLQLLRAQVAVVLLLSACAAAAADFGYIMGTVTMDGEPIANAEVAIGDASGVSNRAGEFFLETFTGSATVTVTLPHGRRYAHDIVVEPGKQELPIEISDLKSMESPEEGEQVFVVLATLARLSGIGRAGKQPSVRGIAERIPEAPALEIRLAGEGFYVVTLGGELDKPTAEELLETARDAGYSAADLYSKADWSDPLPISAQSKPDAAVPVLIEILENESTELRRSARRALGEIGQPAVNPILEQIGRGVYRLDLGGLDALGSMKNWQTDEAGLRKVWNVARGYDDKTIRAALDRAIESFDVGSSLEMLGYQGGEAVKAFQKDHALKQDGIEGPRTAATVARSLRAYYRSGQDLYRAPARLFVHVAESGKRSLAYVLARELREAEFDGQPLVVGEVQVVQTMPKANELRFLKKADSDEARRLSQWLARYLPDVVLRDVSDRYDGDPKVRARTYELWIAEFPKSRRLGK